MAEMNFVPYEELASYYEEDHDAYYDVRESIADAERRCQLPCAKIQENDEERGADHNERIEIYGTDCTVSSVNISQQKFLHTECVFTAVTPIIASEILNTGYTMYYNPFQPEFSQKITGNIINKYRSFYGIPPEGGILFQPVRPDDKNKCVTKYKNLIINAWYGDYLVKAERAVLDFIYHTGLGRRNAAGFGTISEIIS